MLVPERPGCAGMGAWYWRHRRDSRENLPNVTLQFKDGFQSLALADSIEGIEGSAVRTGVTIERVHRPGLRGFVRSEARGGAQSRGRISIQLMDAAGRRETLLCDGLIVTTTQSRQQLDFMDLSPEEDELFGRVRHRNYYTSLVEVDNLSANVFAPIVSDGQLSAPEDGGPFLLYRRYDEGLTVAYLYSTTALGLSEVEQRFIDGLASIHRQVNDFELSRAWTYFPHVGEADLLDGFYERLDALQGANRTWYAGGLFNFEIVEPVVAWSRHLVEQHFL